MPTISVLTQARLKQLLHYNPDTGVFSSNHRRYRGEAVGSNHQGYLRITVDCRHYRAHRLAYLYMEGVFPSKLVDHKNNKRDDNRWENLRCCTHTQNLLNTPKKKGGGYKNVFWDKKTGRWMVRLQMNRRIEYFGYYKDQELAGLVAEEARNKYHGEFANHD